MTEITRNVDKAVLPDTGTKRLSQRSPQAKNGLRIKNVKSYLGLFARGFDTTDSERFGHSDQIGQRPRAHFFHDMPAMDLHGNLSQANLGRNLLVHQAGSDQSQNLALARGHGFKQGLHVRHRLLDFAPPAIPFNRGHHGIQHVLIAKRFGQEIDRAALHGPDGHRNIAMAGHKDDWNMNIRLGYVVLKVEAAQSWQSDVEHQAAGNIRELALQHFRRRTEHLNRQSHRLKEISERPAH